MDLEWAKEIIGVIAQHGPWAVFCFYLAYKHFQFNSKTIEVMTAVKTLIENLDCQQGAKISDEVPNK